MPEEVRLKGREEEGREGGRDGEIEEGLMDGGGRRKKEKKGGSEGVEYEQSGMEGSDRGQLTVLQLDLHYWKEEDIDFCG